MLALALAACEKAPAAPPPLTPTADEVEPTIATALAEDRSLTTLARLVSVAELGPVFDGQGSYTLLAPQNAAFARLAVGEKALSSPQQRPVLVALLRAHILPGQLTPANIADAIARKGGPVTMTTLGGTDVTFSQEGKAIVANNGSSTARLAGQAAISETGAIIPLDAVLLPPPG